MRRALMFLAIAVLVLGLFLLDNILGRSTFVEDKITHLDELQQKQVDVFLQSASLLAGCATLALGGIGALIWDQKKTGKGPARQLLIASAGSALSLYFGYLSYRYLLWMLGHSFFDLGNNFVAVTSALQFGAFFGSIVALADFVFAT